MRSTAVLVGAALMGAALALLTSPRSAAGVAPVPPNVQPPSISGVAQEGRVLRVRTALGRSGPRSSPGTPYAYQWQLCDATGAACVDVDKATDSIYAVRHGDVGHTLRVAVAPLTGPIPAAGPVTRSGAVSAPTAVVAPVAKDAPSATVRPVITGATVVGTVLRVTPAAWAGKQPTHVRYRWRRCDSAGGSCHWLRPSGDTYVLRTADLLHNLLVVVTARNAAGTSTTMSDPTSTVEASPPMLPPKPTAEPVIEGTPVVGSALHATEGAWSGTAPIRFSFQWRRCEGAGKPDASDCRRIHHASSDTYTVRRADVGSRLRVQVTGSNAAGSATSTSNPTGVVTKPPAPKVVPRPTVAPTITGTARLGATLHATHGRWVGTRPISIAYQWVRCGTDGGAPDGSNCLSISGARGRDYRLVQADVGARLRVIVTASNSAGSRAAASNPTAVVQGPPRPALPRNTREPAIVGNAQQGQTLAADGGTWVSATPITLGYQWVRCGADGGRPDGSNCAAIGGATTPKYTLGAADVGHRLRVRVTARNTAGSTTVASNATGTVTQAAPPPGPPRDTREPAIAGTPAQGQTLTVSRGAWAGASPISLVSQWVRCGVDGGRPDGSNCPSIPGATATTYTLTGADVGHRLRFRVTARNSKGSVTVASNATPTIAATEPVRPAGAVRLANGSYSIPVTSVSLPARLIINGIKFTPNPVRTRRTVIRLRVHVVDTRGYVVRNALVFARSTPLVTRSSGERRTGMNGWVTIRLVPRPTFSIRNGYNVQFFVRARKPGDNLLAGVSTRRLVQVRTHR